MPARGREFLAGAPRLRQVGLAGVDGINDGQRAPISRIGFSRLDRLATKCSLPVGRADWVELVVLDPHGKVVKRPFSN